MSLADEIFELEDTRERGEGVDPARDPLAGAPGDDSPEPGDTDHDPRPVLPRKRYRPLVDGAPVVGFTGVNGAGKTLVAVSEAIHDLRQGRRVISTVPIDWHGLRSEPLLSLRQLLELRDCTVLIDEVSVIFSSSASGTLPDDVVTFLQSMRHQRVTLRWTTPAWMNADVQLRRVTQVLVGCHPLMRYRVPGDFWPKPRIIMAGALDTVGIPVDATPERVVGRRVWIPKRLPGWGAYDSEAEVSRIGWHRQERICVDCGGTKRPEPCSPDRHRRLGIDSPLVGGDAGT